MSSEAIADSLFSWIDPAGNTNTLDVDVVMSTNDKRTSKLTDHVVETGAVVTDHIVLQPESVSFELVVTQTPFNAPGFTAQTMSIQVSSGVLVPATLPIKIAKTRFQPGGFLRLTQGLRSLIADAVGVDQTPTSAQGSASKRTQSTFRVSALQATDPVDRVAEAFDTLDVIRKTGLLTTISFKGRLYLDYIITSIELSQGKGEFGMGKIKVEARAFRAVTGVNVALPDPADFRALPKVSKGNTPTKTPDPDPAKRGKTFAKRGATAIDKALGVKP